MITFVWSAFFFMPLFLRDIFGKGAFEIGLLLLPITLLIIIVAPISGKIVDSIGAKLPIIAGLILIAASALIQSTYSVGSSLYYVIFGFVFLGIGWGFIFSSGAFAAISSLPKELAGSASGALWTIQTFGGAVGLAVSGVIFRHIETQSLEKGLVSSNIHLTNHQEGMIKVLVSDPDKVKQLLSKFSTATADTILPIFKNAFMDGYNGAFLFLFGLTAVVLIIIVTMMKNVKKESK